MSTFYPERSLSCCCSPILSVAEQITSQTSLPAELILWTSLPEGKIHWNYHLNSWQRSGETGLINHSFSAASWVLQWINAFHYCLLFLIVLLFLPSKCLMSARQKKKIKHKKTDCEMKKTHDDFFFLNPICFRPFNSNLSGKWCKKKTRFVPEVTNTSYSEHSVLFNPFLGGVVKCVKL